MLVTGPFVMAGLLTARLSRRPLFRGEVAEFMLVRKGRAKPEGVQFCPWQHWSSLQIQSTDLIGW